MDSFLVHRSNQRRVLCSFAITYIHRFAISRFPKIITVPNSSPGISIKRITLLSIHYTFSTVEYPQELPPLKLRCSIYHPGDCLRRETERDENYSELNLLPFVKLYESSIKSIPSKNIVEILVKLLDRISLESLPTSKRRESAPLTRKRGK